MYFIHGDIRKYLVKSSVSQFHIIHCTMVVITQAPVSMHSEACQFVFVIYFSLVVDIANLICYIFYFAIHCF